MTLAKFNHEKDQRFAIHHILLRSAWLADDVMRELSLGASFEELAEEYSACLSATNQGFTGLHLLDQLPETLRIALLTDNGRNPYVGPVKTQFGFHILKSFQVTDPTHASSHENDHRENPEKTDEYPLDDNTYLAIEEAPEAQTPEAPAPEALAPETRASGTDVQIMGVEDTEPQNKEEITSEPSDLNSRKGDDSPSS